MFGREAAPPPPVILSVVDEINYGWTQHLTKSVAYTLPIGKKKTFELAAKNGFDYFEFYPQTDGKCSEVCCSSCSWPSSKQLNTPLPPPLRFPSLPLVAYICRENTLRGLVIGPVQ